MSPPRKAAPPVFSPREFRASLGMFATGVTIVTARTATGELIGLTANSFNSVSLDPPLVLWSLARAAGSLPAFSTGSHYAINILAADQKDLAERFALKGADRWAGVAFTEGAGGAPLLAGAAATFECFNRSRYEEGDHVIFVGEVERCSHRADASPLLFHGGKFYTESRPAASWAVTWATCSVRPAMRCTATSSARWPRRGSPTSPGGCWRCCMTPMRQPLQPGRVQRLTRTARCQALMARCPWASWRATCWPSSPP
jgi:flavin reductase (DIM6/NTAB) family NADH-FMN oxidoreductase RutF